MHPLKLEIAKTKKVLVKNAAWTAAMALVSCVLFALIAIGLGDFYLRYSTPFSRFFSSVAAVSLIGLSIFLVFRFLQKCRFNDLEVAQLIEHSMGGFEDRISTSVALLESGDGHGESTELKQKLVERATRELMQIDPAELVRSRLIRNIGAVCAGAILLSAFLGVWKYEYSKIALTRLAFPHTDVRWPQTNQLAFEELPKIVARNDELMVKIVDTNSKLPKSIRLEYQFQGSQETRTREMTVLREYAFFRIPNVSAPLTIRAIGGDDETAFQEIDVSNPPTLVKSEITVVPPAYTKFQPESFDGDAVIIEGSDVQFDGTSDRKLSSAIFEFEADGIRQQFSANVAPDMLTVSSNISEQLTLRSPGALLLKLSDHDQIVGGKQKKYQINVIRDRPPAISLSTDANTILTRDARVQFKISIGEEIWLRNSEISFSINNSSQSKTYKLFDIEKSNSEIRQPQTLRDIGKRLRQFEFDFELPFADLPDLKEGSVVFATATGLDAKGQLGKSNELSFQIVANSQLFERLREDRDAIISQLIDASDRQQSIAERSSEFAQIWKNDGLDEKTITQLYSTQLAQQEIDQTISNPQQGAISGLRKIVSAANLNHVPNVSFIQNTQELMEQLSQLSTIDLKNIQFSLARSIRVARESNGLKTKQSQTEFHNDFENVVNFQASAAKTLAKIIGRETDKNAIRQLQVALTKIRRGQVDVAEKTAAIQPLTAGKRQEELETSLQKQVSEIHSNQLQIATSFRQWNARLNTHLDELAPDSNAATKLIQVSQSVASSGIQQSLLVSAAQIESNKLGVAIGQQNQNIESLTLLIEMLGERFVTETKTLEKNANRGSEEIDKIADQQRALTDAIQKAASQRNAAQKKSQVEGIQDQIAKLKADIKKLRDRLKDEKFKETARELNSVNQDLDDTKKSVENSKFDKAIESSKAAETKIESTKETLEAELNRLRQRKDQELFQEAASLISETIEKQKRLVSSVESDSSEVANRAAYDEFLRIQNELIANIEKLRIEFANKQAFLFVLKNAEGSMRVAADALKSNSKNRSITSMNQAIIWLQQLVDAFNQNMDQEVNPPNNESSKNESNDNKSAEQDSGPTAIEIQLLIAAQELILSETIKIDKSKSSAPMTDEIMTMINLLGEQQIELEKTIDSYIEKANPAPEKKQENLPSVPGFN